MSRLLLSGSWKSAGVLRTVKIEQDSDLTEIRDRGCILRRLLCA
ncbi:MAG: hypothetical protein O2804_01750 [Verrucomicrobia bacterium]|nr:hypothetical protein [Verrucomicrobiota bacterium]MDA1340042.1 hypothetical protein [Verrucomicrobiota bacterium]